MQEGFELLEQRVQKAVSRLRELREANDTLRSQLDSALARADKAEREAGAAADKGGERRDPGSEVDPELAALRRERDLIRSRLRRIVELLAKLD